MRNDPRVTARNDVLVTLLFIVVVNFVLYQATWVYAGPITALASIALSTFLLRRRGRTWSSLGLVAPPSWGRAAGQAVLVLVGTIVVAFALREVVGQFAVKPATALERFGTLRGDLGRTLWWISIGWVVGGLSEEMLFRGFFLTRLEAIFGRTRGATWLAILLQAILFGSLHWYYKGAYGAVPLMGAAAFIGICYVRFGRNLWPLIFAHGTMNTLGFVAKFVVGEPG